MSEKYLDREEILLSMLYGYSKARDIIFNVFQSENIPNDEFKHCVYNLMKFTAERSISITMLIQDNLLWDAQIMLRCVQEATMKISFLCNCTKEEQKERLREYLYDLDEINSLKRSNIAKNIIKAFNDNEGMILPFKPLVLDSDKEEFLQNKWKKDKRRLEQKWSYSEMLKEQSSKMEIIKDMFLSLAHPYKMSSHLLHADETGVGIIAERSLRSESEKEEIETSHFCSIIVNSLSYLIVSGYSICVAFKKDPKPLFEILKELKPVLDQIDILQAEVYKDHSYDKFR